MMDFTLITDFDDQLFWLQVANVKIVFQREDIDKVIENLETLRDEMNSYGMAS